MKDKHEAVRSPDIASAGSIGPLLLFDIATDRLAVGLESRAAVGLWSG